MADQQNEKNVIMDHQDEAEMDDIQVQNDVTAHGNVLTGEAPGDNIPPGYFTNAYFLGTSLVRYS